MKQILVLIMICISANLFSQTRLDIEPYEYRSSMTIGILEGGGSLIGANMEFLVTDRFGFQLGAGYIGFGGGLNYHFKPTIRSSFISFQYWNQGVGESFAQSALGPSFVYRGKKWFTAQLGLAATLEKGPAMPDDYVQPPVMLVYAIGIYLPI